MEKLKAALSFGGILTKENIEDIISYFEEKELEAGTYFSTVGKVSNEIGFINTGVVRTYAVNEAGEDITSIFSEKINLLLTYKVITAVSQVPLRYRQ